MYGFVIWLLIQTMIHLTGRHIHRELNSSFGDQRLGIYATATETHINESTNQNMAQNLLSNPAGLYIHISV